jgi:hypothetical protein
MERAVTVMVSVWGGQLQASDGIVTTSVVVNSDSNERVAVIDEKLLIQDDNVGVIVTVCVEVPPLVKVKGMVTTEPGRPRANTLAGVKAKGTSTNAAEIGPQ